MNPRRTLAVAKKEFIHIRRDPRSLILIILLPIILLLLYGYALNFDIKHVPLAVYDQEGSQLSQDFINEFRGSRYFRLMKFVSTIKEVERLIHYRTVQAALIIPHDFSRKIKSGHSAQVQAIVDGADANTANIILGYIQAIVSVFNQNLILERFRQQGLLRVSLPVRSEVRFWFNEELESVNFIVPGLIVVIMTMVGALLTALTVVREVERGSLESLLATPLTKAELLLGKMAPYFVIGMVDVALTIFMGEVLFGVPRRGSLVLLVAMAAIFLVATLGHGLLISVTAQNQLQAYQMAMLTTFLPAFLLSGFVFSLQLMPVPLQLLSYVVPARYLVSIAKGVYLKGIGLEVLWGEALMLTAAAAAFLLLALQKFVPKLKGN